MRATCHCGAISVAVPGAPAYLNECHCSICGRYGVRWGYFGGDEVEVAGETAVYVRDGGSLEFHRCGRCGCVTHWRAPEDATKVGVNARLMAAADLAGVPVRVSEGPPD